MHPSKEELQKTYEKMRDDQILNLLEDEGMRPEAIKVLQSIVKKRNIKNNSEEPQEINNITHYSEKKGRINRINYLLYFLLALVINSIFSVLVSTLIYVYPEQTNSGLVAEILIIFLLVYGLVTTIFLIISDKYRCHDI